MRKELKRFVRYFSPGSFYANDWTENIDARAPNSVPWPENAYAFTMHEREDVIDGQKIYKGDSKQIGPMYYHPDSKIETLDEVTRNPKASDILISNMRCNKWEHVVWSRWGNWPQPFDETKAVIVHNSPAQRRADDQV